MSGHGAGACYHALGYARKAVADYQAVFMTPDSGLDTEARGLVCLGFYQKVCLSLACSRADVWCCAAAGSLVTHQ